MRYQSSVWPLIITAVVLFVGTPNTFCQASKRNMKLYKRGSSFDLQNEFSPKQGNAEKAPLRQFLWELWTTHTKGFSNVTFYSREGAPTRCRFFVEPDSKGQWRIISECKASDCPFTSRARCRSFLKQTQTNYYDVVQRIKYGDDVSNQSGRKHSQRLIPDNEKHNPLTFLLVLKDSSSGRTEEL